MSHVGPERIGFNRARESRMPPHNTEAELSVLGSMLLDNTLIDRITAFVHADDFYRDEHRLLFEAILRVYGRGHAVDAITLAEELTRCSDSGVCSDDIIADVFRAVPHAANGIYHAQIVRQHGVKRKLIEGAQDLLNDAYSGFFTAEELAVKLQHFQDPSTFDLDDDEGCFEGWPLLEGHDRSLAFDDAIGRYVVAIEELTEADPVAIYFQALVAFGSMLGRTAHGLLGNTRQYGNLFVAIVGSSALARKGTSLDEARALFQGLDPEWDRKQNFYGMSSGEGVIEVIRDDRVDSSTGAVTAGMQDKRALWTEIEFGATLARMNREGATLSGIVRSAFDGAPLGSMSKGQPARASSPHISIIAHATMRCLGDLRARDRENGLSNRFVWICCRRRGEIAFPTPLPPTELRRHRVAIIEALEWAAAQWGPSNDRSGEPQGEPVVFSAASRKVWPQIYHDLLQIDPGPFGEFLVRGPTIVFRMALLKAVLDRSMRITPTHLGAALNLWRYAEASARYLFSPARGADSRQSSALLEKITAAGARGLTRRDISRVVFRSHKPVEEVQTILDSYTASGLLKRLAEQVQGRTVIRWVDASIGVQKDRK